jgi:hypothetical protein
VAAQQLGKSVEDAVKMCHIDYVAGGVRETVRCLRVKKVNFYIFFRR